MSTKLYTGFKITNLTWRELMLELEDIKKESQIIANNLSNKRQVLDATILFDKITLGEEEKNQYSCIGRVRWNHLEAQMEIKKTNQRNPDLDFAFEICLYPLTHKTILGLYFTEQEEAYAPLITKRPWYQEYAYWNNTDKPDHLTNRQWNKREKDWSFLPYSYTLNQHMFSFVFQEEVQLSTKLSPDDDYPILPLEKRVVVARNRHIDTEIFKEFGGMSLSDYLQRNDNKEFDHIKLRLDEEIKSKLIPNLDLAMLMNEKLT